MISIALDNRGWPETVDWDALAKRAALAALSQTPHASLAGSKREIEISITLADDDAVQALNCEWREKDKPTNVLSFPMIGADEITSLPSGMEAMLGDIVLASGVCAREAAEKDIALSDHATHLVVHGMLHLLGYDHMEDGEADEMEAMERRALAALGLPDPYATYPLRDGAA